MKKINVKTLKINELTRDQVEQMWQLYQASYDYVCKKSFVKDLFAKNYIFLGLDPQTNRVGGFSTVYFYETTYLNKKINIHFSGDTIFHSDYWGSKALNSAMALFLFKKKLKHPFRRLYWNLIASGNRTYLCMARNCAKYYPNYQAQTPSFEKGLIEHISSQQFPKQFNKETGVVEMKRPEAVLKPHLAPFNGKVMELPEIQYFVKANPGFNKGDELSCIAGLSFFNIVSSILKITKKIIKKKTSIDIDGIIDQLILGLKND